MKRAFCAGLTGVFLVCGGCGGEAMLVIKGHKTIDPIIRTMINTPTRNELKLQRSDKLRVELASKRNQLVAQCVTKLRTKAKSPADEARAARLRAEGAKELAYLADKSATLFLTEQTVQDKSKEVKIECIKALGQLEDYTAVPVLIQLLEDLDVEIARAALDSLNMICRPVTYREFTFSGSALRERKKTAYQWRKWWNKGGKDQLAKHAEEKG